MDAQQAAKELDGIQYRQGGDRFSELKEHGLVIVHGRSDDLFCLSGALDDEAGAWEGGDFYLTQAGLVENPCAEGEDCPHWEAFRNRGALIKAVWAGDEDFVWTYETDIPCARFAMYDEDMPYCECLVFRHDDLPPFFAVPYRAPKAE